MHSRAIRLAVGGLIILIAVVAVVVRWRGEESPVGRWFDRTGAVVPNGQPLVLNVFRGSDGCYGKDIAFLAMAWPLSRPVPRGFMGDPRTRIYAWQADQQRPISNQVTTPAVVEALPPDARDSGLHRGAWHLWLSPSMAKTAVFLKAHNTIQRWAFVSEFIPCM